MSTHAKKYGYNINIFFLEDSKGKALNYNYKKSKFVKGVNHHNYLTNRNLDFWLNKAKATNKDLVLVEKYIHSDGETYLAYINPFTQKTKKLIKF